MKSKFIYGFLILLILISGCASYKTAPLQRSIWEDTLPILENIQGTVQDLSFHEMRNTLITNNENLTTFRAHVKLTLVTPDLDGPVHCSGVIIYERPENFRAIGSKLLTTVFDMSSNGNEFWLHIPTEKKMYTGKCDTFRNIDALDVKIFPGDLARLFNSAKILDEEEIVLEMWPAHWLIHMLEIDKEEVNLKGNLFVDRINGDMFKYELFNPDGTPRLQAIFTDYAVFNACRLPQRIDVRWPAYETTLSIIFSNITVNNKVNPEVFQISVPKGVQLIYLD